VNLPGRLGEMIAAQKQTVGLNTGTVYELPPCLSSWPNGTIRTLRRREADMPKMATSEARDNFTELINRAAFQGERTVIRRRGKGMAAIVPMEDFDLLEKVEDLIDRDLLKKARAEVRKAGTIPWEKVKADAGR
jgi:prevent-host-death family protein